MKIYTTFLIACSLSIVFAQENKVAFTENKGQILDQNQNERPDVVAILKSSKGLFIIRKNGFSFQETKQIKENSLELGHKNDDFSNVKKEKSYTVNRVDINWRNSNQNPEIKFVKVLTSHLNFYNVKDGKEAILDVLSYEEIVLKEIYKGVDVRFYLKDGDLEYDYIVREKESLNYLQIEVFGGKFSLLQNGDLNLSSALGNIIESTPKVFREGKEIKSAWKVLDAKIAAFKIKDSKRNGNIVIDPVIREWATYVGGEGGESNLNSDLECDSEGNVYLVGSTSSTSNVVTVGAFSTVLQGITDAFVSKFNRNGNLLWSTYYGGEMFDQFNKIAINSSTNFVCLGQTSSSQNIATNNVFQNTMTGASSTFLVSFNANGQRMWGTYYGNLNSIYGCDIDNLGNICLSSCVSDEGLSTTGAFQETNNGSEDYFLAKLDNTGNRIWATYYGGSEMESYRGASSFFDVSGNVFLIGGTNSDTDIASPNAYQANYNGNEDGMIVKFDGNGNRLWGTYFGGNGSDLIYNGFVDVQGNAILLEKQLQIHF